MIQFICWFVNLIQKLRHFFLWFSWTLATAAIISRNLLWNSVLTEAEVSLKSKDWVLLPHLPHRSLNTGPAEESTHRSGSPWGQSSWRWCLGWWHCHILLCTSCRPGEGKTVVNAQKNLDLFLRMDEGEASLPSFHPILTPLQCLSPRQMQSEHAPCEFWALKGLIQCGFPHTITPRPAGSLWAANPQPFPRKAIQPLLSEHHLPWPWTQSHLSPPHSKATQTRSPLL